MNKVAQIKEMIDFITDNGYHVGVLDFRPLTYSNAGTGKIISDVKEMLKHELKEITIFKEDPIDKTQMYLQGKVNTLKKLIGIEDGSVFDKESVEICDYALFKLNNK